MSTNRNWKAAAADAAKAAGSAAKHYAYISKKRIEIVAEQERIRRAYTKLGKLYYKDYVTDEEPSEDAYTPICDSITDSFRKINRLRKEIEEAKEMYKNPCGETACDAEKESAEEENAGDDYDIIPFTADTEVQEETEE